MKQMYNLTDEEYNAVEQSILSMPLELGLDENILCPNPARYSYWCHSVLEICRTNEHNKRMLAERAPMKTYLELQAITTDRMITTCDVEYYPDVFMFFFKRVLETYFERIGFDIEENETEQEYIERGERVQHSYRYYQYFKRCKYGIILQRPNTNTIRVVVFKLHDTAIVCYVRHVNDARYTPTEVITVEI